MASIGTRFWVPLMHHATVRVDDPTPTAGSRLNMLDYNPDTIYIGSNATNVELEIEHDPPDGIMPGCNCAVAFMRNPSQFPPSGDRRFIVKSSDDFNNYDIRIHHTSMYNTVNLPLILREFDDTYHHKYYWVQVWNNAAPYIANGGLCFVGRTHDVAVRWNWGTPDATAYYGSTFKLFGGKSYARLGNNLPIKTMVRQYTNLNETDMNAIRAAWNDVRGNTYPFVITDDIPSPGWNNNGDPIANGANSKLVKFSQPPDNSGAPSLGEIEVDFQLWNVTLFLSEVPWTGEDFS